MHRTQPPTDRHPMPVDLHAGPMTTPRPQPYRESQSYSPLQQLTQHPLRLRLLTGITTLLELNAEAWHHVMSLRKSEPTQNVLKWWMPQLYQIPDDMIGMLEVLRAVSDWEEVKAFAIRTLVSGPNTPSSTRRSSYRQSVHSSRSSASTAGTSPSPLGRGSCGFPGFASKPTLLMQNRSVPHSPIDPVEEEADGNTLRPKSFYPCELSGCGKVYTKLGNLKRHMHADYHEQPSPKLDSIANHAKVGLESQDASRRELFGNESSTGLYQNLVPQQKRNRSDLSPGTVMTSQSAFSMSPNEAHGYFDPWGVNIWTFGNTQLRPSSQSQMDSYPLRLDGSMTGIKYDPSDEIFEAIQAARQHVTETGGNDNQYTYSSPR